MDISIFDAGRRMSDLLSDSWEKEYLKKADGFEKICQRHDSSGYLHDLQAPSGPAEHALKFLKKVSFYSKVLIGIFVIVILFSHYQTGHSVPYAKTDNGEFERLYPSKVQ